VIAKRALDIVVGVPAAILLTPVIVAIALLVTASSGWPPFIVQTRVGAMERPFRMTKFRTMRVGTPTVSKADLLRSLGERTDAYTPLGRALRRWSLDEFPQIYHVILGTMSLVGPRPALPSQHDLLALRRRARVTELKPGLTGMAQIRGRESLTLPTKVRYEAYYRRNVSIWLDIRILAGTARALVSRRGAL